MDVFADQEFLRIAKLPRRRPILEASESETEECIDLVTNWLKTPEGTMRANAIQAWACVEAYNNSYLVGEVGTGMGKFGITHLLPTVLGAQRTLIFVPAKLKNQTFDQWKVWSKHWRVPPLFGADDTVPAPDGPCVRVMSYESLSHINWASYIEEYDPDLIECDEAHLLAHLSSGRSKRMFRFLKRKRAVGGFDAVRFIPLSGSMRRRSYKECAHIYEAAMGHNSPLPTDYVQLEQWAGALDEGVRGDDRYGAGALLQFLPEGQQPTLDAIRSGVRRRVVETPGVIATSEKAIGIPIIVQARQVQVPEKVKAAMLRLKRFWELPDGTPVDAGLTHWARMQQLDNGFVYRYKVPPPLEWTEARRAWNQFVKDRMEHPGKMSLDTPLMVWNAAEAGHFGPVPEMDRWKAVKDTFVPETVPEWIDDFLIRDAEEWAIKEGGIVWVSHISAVEGVDEEAEIGGRFKKIPFFGAGTEKFVKAHKGPCALSLGSHGTGANYLTKYHKAVFLSMPSSGTALQQGIARLHRIGQLADLVEIQFYLNSRASLNALKTCISNARFQESTSGNPQSILHCNLLNPSGGLLDLDAFEAEVDMDDPMWMESKG